MAGEYLYGASVQGIQDFIFQTNKLKEIVGASELVERICTNMFDDFGGESEKSIVRAAGKIIHIFDNKPDCEKAVLEFPKKVMLAAPGITISQAVVKMEGDYVDYEKASKELEKRLRTQRNKAVRSMTLGLMAISRAPSTGLPAKTNLKEHGKDVLLDEASTLKRNAEEESKNKLIKKAFPPNIVEEIDKKSKYLWRNFEDDINNRNNWLAVIHADGNGLGNIVQAVCKNAADAKTFSVLLDKITEASVQAAYKTVKEKFGSDIIPIRPAVLGGDDLTVICRADLAVDFAKVFIEQFESVSKTLTGLPSDDALLVFIEQFESESKTLFKELGKKYSVVENGLTACAGIAFIKSSYPFHYAYNLAESLCGRAKKKAKDINKELAPSCLMFHKVQDSFVEEFNEIAKRELTPKNTKLSFEYGPYYCGEHAKTFGDKCRNTIDELLDNIRNLNGKEGNAIKSHLRQWLSLLFENTDAANQKMERLIEINKLGESQKNSRTIIEKLNLENFKNIDSNKDLEIPYYDILSLSSILFTDTKNEE
jgi:hypothetical protein